MEIEHRRLEGIARQFFTFDRCLAIAPVGAGNINDTYRIDVETGGQQQSWLLQRLNHRVFTDPAGVMANIQAVAEYLSHQPDFPLEIPAPVRTPDGQLLYRDDRGNYWRGFPFFQNTFAPEQLPDPAIAREAARAYGLFLRALRDFPAEQLVETIPGFHDTDRRWALFIQILEKTPDGRVQQASPEIEANLAVKTVFDTISALKKSGQLPLRVTHNDTKAGNILLDRQTGRAVAVIDWDTIMPGTVLSDFGDMVRTFAPEVREDQPGAVTVRAEVLEALTEGFLSQTADFLTPVEREHLMTGCRWITGEQALRFLTDYLAGDVYYKINYPEHILVRARNQLALFCGL